MRKARSSISDADSYMAIGAFWDTHDLADFEGQTAPVSLDVDLQSETTYYAVDRALSARIVRAARKRGISPETLANLWLQEKLQEQVPQS